MTSPGPVAGTDAASTVPGGAVPEQRISYGDPAAEYWAVRDAAGVVDRDDLAHLVLSGRDPVRMVQGLITNDLESAPVERAVYGAMLTPKGRTIAELRSWKEPGAGGVEVHLDLPREVLAATTEHLRRSVPPLYARWRDASEALGTIGVYGPHSHELLSAVLPERVPVLGEDDLTLLEGAGATIRLIGTRYSGGEGYDLIAERPILRDLQARLLSEGKQSGVLPVGFAALETLRIEAGRPRGGHELTEETIPTEAFESTGLMDRAISFGKGCYTGQEVIVRIAHRGHVNRLLRGLLLQQGASGAARGVRIFHPETGRDVGWITSVAESPRMRAPVALAFVRREVAPGEAVRLEHAAGPEARVQALPFTAPPGA
jgi:folate-binding protein YgfZ